MSDAFDRDVRPTAPTPETAAPPAPAPRTGAAAADTLLANLLAYALILGGALMGIIALGNPVFSFDGRIALTNTWLGIALALIMFGVGACLLTLLSVLRRLPVRS
jgi:hypothetical protein